MQVNAVGDLCAICQEKMHAPILLRCKHMFCEECVSEWSVHSFIPCLDLLNRKITPLLGEINYRFLSTIVKSVFQIDSSIELLFNDKFYSHRFDIHQMFNSL